MRKWGRYLVCSIANAQGSRWEARMDSSEAWLRWWRNAQKYFKSFEASITRREEECLSIKHAIVPLTSKGLKSSLRYPRRSLTHVCVWVCTRCFGDEKKAYFLGRKGSRKREPPVNRSNPARFNGRHKFFVNFHFSNFRLWPIPELYWKLLALSSKFCGSLSVCM